MNCDVWSSSPNICITIFICQRRPSNVKIQWFAWEIKDFSVYVFWKAFFLKKKMWESLCVSSISGLIKRSRNWQLETWNYFKQIRNEFKFVTSACVQILPEDLSLQGLARWRKSVPFALYYSSHVSCFRWLPSTQAWYSGWLLQPGEKERREGGWNLSFWKGHMEDSDQTMPRLARR
jgi:hypothetical protein